MRNQVILGAALAALAAGCSSSISAKALNARPGDTVDGLPFRLSDNIEIEVFELTPKGYKQVAQKVERMADPSRTYVLQMTGQPLSNPTLQINLYADATIKDVDLKNSNQVDEALASVGGSFKEAATANAELRKVRKADDVADAVAVEAKIEADYTEELAVQTLTDKLDVARAQLLELKDDTPPSVRRAKEGEITSLELQLARAKRKAGN